MVSGDRPGQGVWKHRSQIDWAWASSILRRRSHGAGGAEPGTTTFVGFAQDLYHRGLPREAWVGRLDDARLVALESPHVGEELSGDASGVRPQDALGVSAQAADPR